MKLALYIFGIVLAASSSAIQPADLVQKNIEAKILAQEVAQQELLKELGKIA